MGSARMQGGPALRDGAVTHGGVGGTQGPGLRAAVAGSAGRLRSWGRVPWGPSTGAPPCTPHVALLSLSCQFLESELGAPVGSDGASRTRFQSGVTASTPSSPPAPSSCASSPDALVRGPGGLVLTLQAGPALPSPALSLPQRIPTGLRVKEAPYRSGEDPPPGVQRQRDPWTGHLGGTPGRAFLHPGTLPAFGVRGPAGDQESSPGAFKWLLVETTVCCQKFPRKEGTHIPVELVFVHEGPVLLDLAPHPRATEL